MTIETGELFVVTRGWKLGSIGLLIGIPESGEPAYDRSHEGNVYRALEVCGPMMAGEIVYAKSYGAKIGDKRPINTNEVEVWPVTESYLAALTPVDTAATTSQ